MATNNHVFAVILAGGGGTRLWPKSREATPKQFLRLTGKDTMLQVTADRVSKLVPWENIIVVTNQKYREEVTTELPRVPKLNIIAEPKKRDTALAMLVGALYARSIDPEAIVMNAASDHVVTNDTEYTRVMQAAISAAQRLHHLVTVGITPAFASSAFGYIKIGDDLERLDKGLTLFKVDGFTEKPNTPTARAFISTGKYFWNANMYVWAAKDLITEFSEHMPAMLEQANTLMELTGQKFHDALEEVYAEATSISIDYAVSEKSKKLVLIPGDFGWNDVGNWDIVYELGQKDLAGNVTIGEDDVVKLLTINAHNNLIHTNGRLVALIGVRDLVVVDTGEILMICPRDMSQDVKKVVDRLKEDGKKEYL